MAARMTHLLGSVALIIACGRETRLVFVPMPEPVSASGAVIYVLEGPEGADIIAADPADDPPLRAQILAGPKDRIVFEALLFEQSLAELGLSPGPITSSEDPRAVPVAVLAPTVLSLVVSAGVVGSWSPSTRSGRAASFRVAGPCPAFQMDRV